jgi:uncharacterized protein (DUF2237 family)
MFENNQLFNILLGISVISVISITSVLYDIYSVSNNEKFFIGGDSKNQSQKLNILGTPLKICCDTPNKVTGYYRDGNCLTGPTDYGTHIVCAVVDDRFLQFTKSRGNDLITPHPPSFNGLKSGDRWCLCISRWIEAYKAGKAPKIIAESTNEMALKYISKEILMRYNAI